MRIDNASAYDVIEWASRIVALEIPAGRDGSGRDPFLARVRPFLDACTYAYVKGRNAGREGLDDKAERAAYNECMHAIAESFKAQALAGDDMPRWVDDAILSRWRVGKQVGASERVDAEEAKSKEPVTKLKLDYYRVYLPDGQLAATSDGRDADGVLIGEALERVEKFPHANLSAVKVETINEAGDVLMTETGREFLDTYRKAGNARGWFRPGVLVASRFKSFPVYRVERVFQSTLWVRVVYPSDPEHKGPLSKGAKREELALIL